jgi:hypothetical protein
MSYVPTAAMFANGGGTLKLMEPKVSGEYVDLLGESYYCIRHYDTMSPFFMSIISSANH